MHMSSLQLVFFSLFFSVLLILQAFWLVVGLKLVKTWLNPDLGYLAVLRFSTKNAPSALEDGKEDAVHDAWQESHRLLLKLIEKTMTNLDKPTRLVGNPGIGAGG